MIQIFKKVFLNQIRNPKWLLFLVLFPIVLVVLIGTILNGAFNSKKSLDDVQVVVLNKSTGDASHLIDTVSSATVAKNYGIVFSKTSSVEEGKREVRLDKKIFLNAVGDQIKIYYNEADNINGSRIMQTLQGIANSVEVTTGIYKINPKLAMKMLNEKNAKYELPQAQFTDKNFMTSFDYYGVAEITLMMLYLALLPLADIFRDRDTKIKNRMKLAGISDFKYYFSSMAAYLTIAAVSFLPGFLVTIYAYGVNWGPNPVLAYLYLMIFCVFSIIVGMFLAVFLKSRGKVDIIMAVVIFPVVSFLGGSYSPFPFTFDTVLEKLTLISPVRWVNLGLFRYLYNDDFLMLIISIILLIGFSTVLFTLMVWKSGKDDVSA